jgi:peptidoglycan/LPS O-acetylase OafA/YrhL
MLYISNFVLEITNTISKKIMKRTTLVLIVAGLVLIASAIWFFLSYQEPSLMENLHLLIIILLVAFALFFGYKRLTSERRGQPAEDEMSKKVMQKAAALSYFISLYLWVFMIYLKDRVAMDVEILIGSGILGMGVIFALSWLYFNFRGIRNE